MANVDIFKDLTIKINEEGVTAMSVPGAFGILVDCEYWHVGGEGDPWRYRLSGADGPRYAYSHPSEHGCQIAIKRHFVSVGLVKVPEDNSHLDEENQLIAAGILANWNAQTGVFGFSATTARGQGAGLMCFCRAGFMSWLILA